MVFTEGDEDAVAGSQESPEEKYGDQCTQCAVVGWLLWLTHLLVNNVGCENNQFYANEYLLIRLFVESIK